jgi:hypothetical protein
MADRRRIGRRFARAPRIEVYSPGRLDARVAEAKAFLSGAAHLRNLSANGLRCQFNLRPATAEHLLAVETQRREEC